MDGKTINTRIILKLSIFILAWVIIAMLGIFGIILMTNMEGSAATVSVIGAMANGGIIHPTYVLYNDMNASALYLYSILMVIGRLEIMPFLVLFRRSAWK
jgi:Trk-type K+ transport system membrane component